MKQKTYKKRADFSSYQEYYHYVFSNLKSTIETPFFHVARWNGLNEGFEWQKEFKYYNTKGEIKRFHVDFYYEDETGAIKLAIECDDTSHNQEKQKKNDAIRDDYLRSIGIKVLRFPSKEIWRNCEECVKKVLRTIAEERQILIEKSQNRIQSLGREIAAPKKIQSNVNPTKNQELSSCSYSETSVVILSPYIASVD